MMLTAYKAITVRVLPTPEDLSGIGSAFSLHARDAEVTVFVGERGWTTVAVEFSAENRRDPANLASPPRDTVSLRVVKPRQHRDALRITPQRDSFAPDHQLLHTTLDIDGLQVGDYAVRLVGIINRPGDGGINGTVNYVERELVVRVRRRRSEHPGFEGIMLDDLPEGGDERAAGEAAAGGGDGMADPIWRAGARCSSRVAATSTVARPRVAQFCWLARRVPC